MILKDEDYIPSSLFKKIKDQFPDGVYMLFDFGELMICKDGESPHICVRTIGELKAGFLKYTGVDLKIPEL